MIQQWDSLQEQARSGGVSRRQFIAAAAALGVSGSLIETAWAQAPKRGGHLTVGSGQGSSADGLDPAKWTVEFVYVAGLQVYDSLIFANEKGELVPFLAESWESKGGAAKEWVLKLRKGVTFHNGKTLTPADVVYSLNHHRNKTSLGRAMVSAFEDVKATGPNEVTIILNSPNLDLPYLLTAVHLVIAPENSNFVGIGTGPFVLESFQPGIRMGAKRNVNDWKRDRGYVDTLDLRLIPDPTARVSAVLSGQCNIITRTSPNSVGPVQNNPNIQIFSIAGGQHQMFIMFTDRPPYGGNLDLRLALKYAIDREAVVKTAMRGYAKIGNDHPIPEHLKYFSRDIPQRKYDPDKSKFHLKKSGYTGPVILAASDGAFVNGLACAEVFQASARATGIDFRIKAIPSSGYWTQFRDGNTFFETGFGGRATADLALTAELSSDSPINEGNWKNQKFDQLLVAARAETNEAKRKQLYHDLQFLAHEEGGNIVAFFPTNIELGTKNVRNYIPSPLSALGGFRAIEQIWLSDS